MLPDAAPVAAPAAPPAFAAEVFRLRLYEPIPPAEIIQLATVGMVK